MSGHYSRIASGSTPEISPHHHLANLQGNVQSARKGGEPFALCKIRFKIEQVETRNQQAFELGASLALLDHDHAQAKLQAMMEIRREKSGGVFSTPPNRQLHTTTATMKTKQPDMKTRLLNLRAAFCIVTSAALLVAGGCMTDSYTRSMGETADDKAASARVKSALDDDAVYKFPMVQVSAFKGTVQLSGFVLSQDQKDRAGEIAKELEGVNEIQNNITVKSKN